MRKPTFLLPTLMIAGFFGIILAPVPSAAEKVMSVQIRRADLRSGPSYLTKPVARAAYGDRLFINAEKIPWYQVRDPKSGKTGWLHQSALTPKIVKLTAGKNEVAPAASSDELQLAGKGFNQEVEQEFKKRNQKIRFDWVDKMSRITVSQKRKQDFIQTGKLKPQEGAQ